MTQIDKKNIENFALKQEVILDKILNYCRNSSYVNLLIALNLDMSYTIRCIKIIKKQNNEEKDNNLIRWHNLNTRTLKLLKINIFGLNYDFVCENFEIIWELLKYEHELLTIKETFFLKYKNLIDLRDLKFECALFGDRNLDMIEYCEKRIFSKEFHIVFPTYSKLNICWECKADVSIMGLLCNTCKENQCVRCCNVDYPLIYNNYGCCSGCDGCSQYDSE